MAADGHLTLLLEQSYSTLRDAQDPSVVLGTLQDVARILKVRGSEAPRASTTDAQVDPETFEGSLAAMAEADAARLRAVFFERHYARWASFVLSRVSPNWLPCFTAAQRRTAFEAFFTLAPADEAFIALADGLGRSDDEFTTGMIVELLGQYLEPGSIGEFDRGVRSRV